MKVIKDEDLLSLHYQIEKSEIEQTKLQNLLKEKSGKLRSSKKSNRLLGSLLLLFLLLTIFLIANAFYFNKKTSRENNAAVKKGSPELLEEELATVKEELESLKKEKQDIKEIKDLYLYRSLINQDTVYSVQLKTFGEGYVPSISEKYTNALTYRDTSYYKISLGIFETLPEAQEFRRTLISSGFSKRIFVISYKNGKRLRIEDYN